MGEQPVGMRYLGGWGGDFETEAPVASVASQANVLDLLYKRLKLRAQKEREYIYKKWALRFDRVSTALFEEEDKKKILEKDGYLKKVRQNLNLL